MITSPLTWSKVIDGAIDHDSLHSSLPPDRLTFWVLAYLALPNVLFLMGWLEPVAGTLLVALLLLSLYGIGSIGPAPGFGFKTVAALLSIAAVWSALGGAGHLFFANPDWAIRDAVLGDLVFGDWPVSYGNDAGLPTVLRSAIGYFLPAAAIAKSFGVESADAALYYWTVLGVVLFLRVLPLSSTRGPALGLLCLVIIMFSGMDILGILIKYGHLPPFPYRLEWWVPFSYTSLSGQLFWAPNHALPIWLLTGLFYRHWAHPDFPRLAVVALPMSLIWTPFAAAGMAPFIGLAALRCRIQRTPLRVHPTQVAFAMLIGYAMFRFLGMDIDGLPVHGTASSAAEGVTAAAQYRPSSLDYLLFAGMEFGILALGMLPLIRNSYGLYAVSVAVLLLLPVYGFGPSNDTMLRLSISPLVVILILILRLIQDFHAQAGRWPVSAWVVGAVLLLGVPTPIFEMSRAILWERIPPDYTKTLIETQKGALPAHYVAHLNRTDVAMWLKEPRELPASR